MLYIEDPFLRNTDKKNFYFKAPHGRNRSLTALLPVCMKFSKLKYTVHVFSNIALYSLYMMTFLKS